MCIRDRPEPAPSPDEPASMKASRTSLAELECKLPGLPAETQASVRAIMQSANNILGCMATDPRDVDHGARFLKRYLAATHGIVDTHLSLIHIFSGERFFPPSPNPIPLSPKTFILIESLPSALP